MLQTLTPLDCLIKPGLLLLCVLLLFGCDSGSDKSQLLIQSAEQGDSQAIRQLLFDRADINARDKCQWTPLMQAAANGHTDTVKLLLQQGALFELGDVHAYTPLLLAAGNGHTNIAALLLDYGADINHQDLGSGNTALILAVKNHHTALVELLISQKADILIKDNQGQSALNWAENSRDKTLISLLQSTL